MKILIVEDEQALSGGLKFNFEQEGFEAIVAVDGPTALELFESAEPPFDIVVLDLMLPGMSGYEICRRLRDSNSQVPILVLSARTLSEDKAMAFDCGSDQYMTKPFALPELLSRVRNLIERRGAAEPRTRRDETFQFANGEVDFNLLQVKVGGETHGLTGLESQLLRYFVDNDGIVLSRREILEDVWGETSDVTTRSIDNFVMRLRRLIESDPADPKHILSVRGVGYRFVAEP